MQNIKTIEETITITTPLSETVDVETEDEDGNITITQVTNTTYLDSEKVIKKLVIYDSETGEDLAIIPDNQAQRDAWAEQLEIRKESIKTSVDEQLESDAYHISLYDNFLKEYDREIKNISD